ncbi:NAD(P)/FAD-dependent oxidoreductase [Streptomyces albidus (ex Kaewkla and Franco 2022)]|uniref:NAD(P)/FAD-dependent oxidoreductase n=1 Tax=Streptomyces albidus (ex Kaewkla and Franco 2022) TaxID=722709 RepID=UPI0015EE6943|nr:FAD-dependent oxidoreductase [Streptomyces albidus (ex Kaewkla and Franco 2022)]
MTKRQRARGSDGGSAVTGAGAAEAVRALAGARPVPFWLDDPEHRPDALPALTGDAECDLLVVGGGYSGLWTALIAKERDPSRDVLLIEGKEIGWAASGRNGGFCDASLTHGYANGLARWPDEFATLERLGNRNLDSIEAAVDRYGIDCDFERTGEIEVAREPHQVSELRDAAEQMRRLGLNKGDDGEESVTYLDGMAVREEVDSPAFLAGLWHRHSVAMLNPAKLAWGLKRACVEAGVRIHENTRALQLAADSGAVTVRSPYGSVRARQVALGTNAFPSLLRRVRPYVVPVYDYALMTEPMTEQQRASIGWNNRQGLADSANHFHYFRLTRDNRILWGGYDILYHYGSRIAEEFDQCPETFRKLAGHFFDTFPQLAGLRFSHTWGGVIDTCSRFSPFFGTAHGGRVSYAAGFTGLGVGATRFGAEVMLDLLSGEQTELTELELVRRKPVPFPPEPVRWAGIALTQWSLSRADARGGRRNMWLKAMDATGMGFDS